MAVVRQGPKYQAGDKYYPKKPIPVQGLRGEYIYPTDGVVTIVRNCGKKDWKHIVVVVDGTGRQSEEIKAQLYLAKNSRA